MSEGTIALLFVVAIILIVIFIIVHDYTKDKDYTNNELDNGNDKVDAVSNTFVKKKDQEFEKPLKDKYEIQYIKVKFEDGHIENFYYDFPKKMDCAVIFVDGKYKIVPITSEINSVATSKEFADSLNKVLGAFDKGDSSVVVETEDGPRVFKIKTNQQIKYGEKKSLEEEKLKRLAENRKRREEERKINEKRREEERLERERLIKERNENKKQENIAINKAIVENELEEKEKHEKRKQNRIEKEESVKQLAATLKETEWYKESQLSLQQTKCKENINVEDKTFNKYERDLIEKLNKRDRTANGEYWYDWYNDHKHITKHSYELDLHGLTSEEAEFYLRTVLSNLPYQSKFREINIIHGYNSGTVLKDMVQKKFTHPRIKSKRADFFNEGITIFILNCENK